MKNTKVDFGPRCTRCNKKVSPSQQSTLRFERTGVCAHCANEYNGALRIAITPGSHALEMITEPTWQNDAAPLRCALVEVDRAE